MKRDFSGLSQKDFDLIVIGGGIIGTGIARDAALRGLRTLLAEKEDFGYGTTSRSTRLIHGGLRYLRMLEFKLVRQDLREREVLLHIAPHLVQKLKFIIPLLRTKPFYRLSLPIGLLLYDILASGKSVPSRQRLSLKEALREEPSLTDTPGLVGGYVFYDCQAQNMERLCLENALGADQKGACILNHTETAGFLMEGRIVRGIQIKDRLTGTDYQVKGRIVVNAAGPWANLVWNKLSNKPASSLRLTKGIHLVTRQISRNALVLFAKSDGRLFFAIPWKEYSLLGTTDTDYAGDPDKVQAEKADVDYLISETRHYFPQFKQEDIYYTMAGLRPLVAAGQKAESNISRAHKIIDHERSDGMQSLISILGGKITAYRAIAEEAVDLVCLKLKTKLPCTTAENLLPGAPALTRQEILKIAESEALPVETVSHLANIYGSQLYGLIQYLDQDRRFGSPIAPGYPDIRAQVKYSIDEEEALTLSDYMLRRSLSGLRADQGRAVIAAVAHEMQLILGWSDQEAQKQVQDYQATIALSQNFHQAET